MDLNQHKEETGCKVAPLPQALSIARRAQSHLASAAKQLDDILDGAVEPQHDYCEFMQLGNSIVEAHAKVRETADRIEADTRK